MTDYVQARLYTKGEMRVIPHLFVNRGGLFKSSPYEIRRWFSFTTTPEKVVNTRKRNSRTRYLEVSHKGVKYLVHRILASTFKQIEPGCDVVRHLDDDIYNNDLSNLCWGTPKENMRDALLNDKIPKGTQVERSLVVQGFDSSGVLVHEFCGKTEIQRNGFWQSNVHKACKTNKPYKGIFWKIKDEQSD